MAVTGTGIARHDRDLAARSDRHRPGLFAGLPAGSALSVSPADNPFDTPDSLLEYFLVNVETQPPVQTSRIRLALSQVQLLIERVLLPGARGVRRGHRRVALGVDEAVPGLGRPTAWCSWSGNWLYPELRDNQSPFFQQMISALLQGDITDDAATSAYLDYLTTSKRSRTRPCGLYYQPGGADVNETSYVVARAAGAPRILLPAVPGRQLDTMDQVMIDCEGMPVTPIVWNGRLFLFWLKAVKQGQAAPAQITPASGTTPTLGGLPVTDLNSSVTTATRNAAAARARTSHPVLDQYSDGKWQTHENV